MSHSGLVYSPQMCMNTSKCAGGCFNSLEGRYLQTVSYTKARLNNKPVGSTVLDKTQRNIGLVIAVLKVMSYSVCFFISAHKFDICCSVDLLYYVR